MTKLHIFRHGETKWNQQGLWQGTRQDIPLNTQGRKQAHDAAIQLADEDIQIAYSSTSLRAIETAKILLGERNMRFQKMDQFCEMNHGEWEGQHKDDVRNRFPEEHNAFWKCPGLYKSVGGENFHELQARAVTAVRGILKDHQGQTILLVTHGAFIKVVLAFFEGRDFDNLWEAPSVDNLAHSIIEEKNNGNYEIVLYSNKKWRMK